MVRFKLKKLAKKEAKLIIQVEVLNISMNLNNPVGITTWSNSALIGATSGSIAKDIFKSDKKEKK
ncbi:hypothetical protein KTJ16_20655 [Acinetobacter bereziniae]|jgi:hypothetical protein|uniref:Uncharacterized protein n=1 Tax=Acinetobacter bereziniae TaxID=106648 RepID=A0A8I1AMC8_ACIBZ|nr:MULTISPECIES: hypothetical protein [Acinetobacter]KKW76854.1 hypothetical protein AAV97_15890 [Acinetobacter sp. Ag2]MBJ8424354.1 hypothetical protein [Acinetobacter bereziniae]MBJ8554785.1 hypothetical protein [Acinetobacter bereziniae]MBJ9905334.1 hypothetical protein [Acinetobacter bereziniae]MBJ9951379.1 hypothetical protein [Acinetobacter bereziniae]